MTTAVPPITPAAKEPAVPEDPIFRLSVEQYHEMIRNGILTEDDPVELLEGWLTYKMSKNPPRSVATNLAADALRSLSLPGWCVRSQEPITTNDSEPEPDVALARGAVRDYVNRHPSPGNIALVVEVADATLEQDRRTKLRAYASARLPVYWIVNLVNRHVEIYTRPSGPVKEPSYADHQDVSEGDSIAVTIDGREVGRIEVSSILP